MPASTLGCRPHGQTVGTAPLDNNAGGLERKRIGYIFVSAGSLGNKIGCIKALLNISMHDCRQRFGPEDRNIQRYEITRKFIVQLRCVGFNGPFHVINRRQAFVRYFNEIQSLPGHPGGFRRYQGNRITDESYFFVQDAHMSGCSGPPSRNIFIGQNGLHSPEFFGSGSVDIFDQRMRIRTAEHLAVQHSGKVKVVYVFCPARDDFKGIFAGGRFTNESVIFGEFHFFFFCVTVCSASST